MSRPRHPLPQSTRSRRARAASTVALATIAMTLGASSTSAHIPGADDSGTVVITDSTALTVTVNPAGATAATITGRISNATGNRFDCHTPGVNGAKYPGQVTEAGIVADAMRYYSATIFSPIGGMLLPVTGVTLDPVPTGSLGDFLPTGSATVFLGKSLGGAQSLRAAQESARIAGHTGDPAVNGATDFSVPARGAVNFAAALGYPASGTRTDFDAAAMFFCTDAATGKAYVFAGYELGSPPRP